MDKHTEVIKKRYDRTARFYDLSEKLLEMGKMKNWRQAIWKLARGSVLEVGVGTGRNIMYYPDDIHVTGIDFSSGMLEKARDQAKKLNKQVTLIEMDVQELAFPDETFDTIISTCVFCSVPDPVMGLKEIQRVLKRDGQILMLEHVRSHHPLGGFFMDLLNPVFTGMIGCNINRKTVENIRVAGLLIEKEENLMMDMVKHLECRKG